MRRRSSTTRGANTYAKKADRRKSTPTPSIACSIGYTLQDPGARCMNAPHADLDALRALGRKPRLKAEVSVLRRDVYATRRDSWRFVGVGALLGRGTSRAKAEASRSNGRKGGRPRIARAIPVN